MGGTEVRRRARNASPSRKARGIEGDLREGEAFCRPAQDRGGPVSCSRPDQVEQFEALGTFPGRNWPPLRSRREREDMRSLTDLAADLDVSTEQVLIALQVVATRAGVDDLADWAAKELEGYAEEDELPTHRRWELTIFANLYNPYQAFVSRAHVPIAREYREKATIYHCRDDRANRKRIVGWKPERAHGSRTPEPCTDRQYLTKASLDMCAG